MAWTSKFVGVCFSPAGLNQRTETRTQSIRLPLCIDQTVCSRFRRNVLLIQGFQATNSYSPSQYFKSREK